jgi:hypothetical protein
MDCTICQGYIRSDQDSSNTATNPTKVLKCIQIGATMYQCLCGIIKAEDRGPRGWTSDAQLMYRHDQVQLILGILTRPSICVRYNGRTCAMFEWSMTVTCYNMQVAIHEGFEILDCNKEQMKKKLTRMRGKIEEINVKLNVATQSISTQTDDPFIDCKYIKSVETIPVYDYSMIKKQNQALHCEFKAMYRIFSRLIRIRYSERIANLTCNPMLLK